MNIKRRKVPTKQELITDLNKIVDRKQELEYHFGVIEEVFDNVTGSPLYEASFMTLDVAVDLLVKKYDLCPDTMCWFLYDCDCGKNPQTIEYTENGKDKTITVIDSDTFVQSLPSLK